MSQPVDPALLERGLEIVESFAVWQSGVAGAEEEAEALLAVAAIVRRELERTALEPVAWILDTRDGLHDGVTFDRATADRWRADGHVAIPLYRSSGR